MIEIRLFATFREGRPKISFLDADQYHTVNMVLDYFNIPCEDVAICLVNGMHSKVYTPIKDGDILALFPPVGGG